MTGTGEMAFSCPGRTKESCSPHLQHVLLGSSRTCSSLGRGSRAIPQGTAWHCQSHPGQQSELPARVCSGVRAHTHPHPAAVHRCLWIPLRVFIPVPSCSQLSLGLPVVLVGPLELFTVWFLSGAAIQELSAPAAGRLGCQGSLHFPLLSSALILQPGPVPREFHP